VDAQQALLLELLRRAAGAPVSYRRLRDAGIEYPASVVSELELAGLPLERSHDGPRLLGVRLDPRLDTWAGMDIRDEGESIVALGESVRWLFAELDRARLALVAEARRARLRLSARARAVADAAGVSFRALRAANRKLLGRARPLLAAAAPGIRRAFGASGARRTRAHGSPGRRAPNVEAHARWVAPSALIILAALVGTLAAGNLSGVQRSPTVTHPRPRASRASTMQGPRRPPPQHPPATATTPVSPALAAELEARGHELLATGQPPAAIPVLQQALQATGKTLPSCLEPVSEACLTYAYALYDLGRALRLDLRPAAAVPLLEQRLRIANQRPTVQAELQLAREEAVRPVLSARTG
jgi:hypothetical protein